MTTDGNSTITVQLKDAAGNNLAASAGTVALSTTIGTLGTVTDNNNGTYTATLTSTATGTATITGTLDGIPITDDATVMIGPGAVAVATTTITAVPTSMTTDGSSIITVQLKDAAGNNLAASAGTVALSTTIGTLGTVTDNNNGTYTATLTSAATGTATITGTLDGIAISNDVEISIGVGSADITKTVASVPAGTAGKLTTITITVGDGYGNPVTGVSGNLSINVGGSNAGATVSSIVDNSDGTYTVTYTPTKSGDDEIAITLGGIAINGSPYNSAVSPAVADASNTTATVPAGTAGEPTTVTITVLDEYDNPVTGVSGDLSILVTGTNAGATVSAVTDNSDGTYTVTYTPTKSGDDDIAITLGGIAISGSPYSSAVSPAVADASNTSATVPAGIAGEPTTITITVLDEYGNPVTGVGGDLSVSVTGVNAGATVSSIVDNSDGTYTVTYTPTKSGDDDIAITLGGIAISGSPYSSAVSPAVADASNTTATVPAGIAGEPTTATITVLDEYGNPIMGVGGDLSVSVTGANAGIPVSSVVDHGDGTYTVTYTPTTSGTDNIAIVLDGTAINGSPYSSDVIHSALAKIILASDGTDLASGATRELAVTLQDMYGNTVTSGTESSLAVSFVQLTGNGSVSGLTTMNAAGGVANLTITGEKPGDIFLLAAITTPALTSNQLSFTITVDKTNLQSAITEAEGLTESNYSPASWLTLESALTAAESVNNMPAATQSEVDAAEQALRDAISGLSVDKIGLQSAIDEAGSLMEADYSPASWSTLESALAAAKTVNGNTDVTQTEVDAAEQALRDAISGLAVDKSGLQSTIDEAGSVTEADYSPSSWSAFEQALEEAETVYADPHAKQSEVDAAEQALREAMAGLSVDKSALEALVTYTEDLSEPDWSPASWLNLQDALAIAQRVLDDTDATQTEVDAALSTLQAAIDNLSVDKTNLQSAIVEAGGLTASDYSPSSWSVLEQALEEAQAVYADPSATQSATDAAEQALREAMAGLRVDKSALQQMIGEGLELDENNYTPASWADFEDALGEARTVLDDPAATQAEVDAARMRLDNARSKLTAGDAPSAPRNVVATAGDREIDLAWTVPENGGSTPITDYIIQYTLDDGISWTTVVDGVAAATTVKIAGLTNNVPYRLRVAAINAAGTGAFSAPTLTVVPTIPVPDETGELPTPQPGEAIVIVDGEPKSVTLEVIDNSYLRLSGEGFTMDLTSIGINGQVIPITDVDAVIRINRGQGTVVQVTGHGFEPGTVVTIYIFSLPQLLGYIPVQADGTFAGTLAIPADLSLGRHTLQANGVVRNTGAERSVSVGVLVVEELEQQINFAPLPDKTYGDDEITLQGTATSGLPISYRITDMQGNNTDIATLVEGNRVRINGAGTVQIIASQSGAGNYGAAKDVVRTLVIQPAALLVSVQAVDRPYGEANPAFVLHYTGFVSNDTERALEQAPVATTVAMPSSDVGVYPITIAGGKSTNYVFEYTPSTLTIVRAHQQIEFNAPDELDREAGRVPLDVRATSGLPVSLAMDDGQVAKLDGQNLEVLRVGTVTLTATQAGNANYYPADPVVVTVRITDGSDFPVRVHKAVSPNGDGINEFLMIEGIKDFPENRVTIISKNGTVLFEVSGYDNGNKVFRGISTGQLLLPAGTYFYVVEIKESGKWRAQKGYFVMRY
ncbi:filamin/ABP280 repeat domain-containing protein [Parapedobacter sp. 2B3]|uniref:filamin/ABP280 repeat domain-containing protein n=1 Tax=Parapedobacter sp. 2B3 TaxID=3342381 RepID=UPI0035B63929